MIMINKWLIAILALTIQMAAAQDVKVVSSIEEDEAYENMVLKGTVTVTHNQQDKVDTQSFLMEDKHLLVELIDTIKISPADPLQISIFRFNLPGKPKGLHVLPSVSVKVAGKRYQSPMSSFEVQGQADSKPAKPMKPASQQAPTNAPASVARTSSRTNVLLKLDAVAEGKMPLYPGQRAKLLYRYYFNEDIELTSELLPLLDADGLIKVGEKEIKDYTKDGMNIREISQEVEADKPGSYSFGPSVIEGYAYEIIGGKRRYTSAKIKYEAPVVVVTVSPFPADGKPASFNGAVGSAFQFKVSLLTDSLVSVGDEIALSVDISGSDNIKNVPLPEICCQPGFSGFFRMDDLPPVGEMHGEAKNFVVRMRPLTEKIHEIPSIEFSFFDPHTSQYKILRSSAIPITVKPLPSAAQKVSTMPEHAASLPENKKAEYASSMPEPIEIETIFSLETADLHNKPFGNWWVLGLIPVGIAMLMYQIQLKEFLARQQTLVKPKTSQDLLKEVSKLPAGSQAYFSQIVHALKTALFERKLLSSVDVSAENMPEEGVAGEVRRFLLSIEERRFAGHTQKSDDQWLPKAEELWNKIQGSTVPQKEV